MIVTGATIGNLNTALEALNIPFQGNITLRDVEQIGPTRIKFRLDVKDSKGPGSRTSPSPFRPKARVHAACWHAHGFFFNFLLIVEPDAVIRTAHGKIDAKSGNWEDYVVGPPIWPVTASKVCDCK